MHDRYLSDPLDDLLQRAGLSPVKVDRDSQEECSPATGR